MSETLLSTFFISIMFIFGGIGLVSGVITFVLSCAQVKKWRRAEGTVIGPLESSEDDYPRIEFQDHAGHVHTFRSNWKLGGKIPATGSRVQVLYDPHNPDNAIHHTVCSTYIMPLLLSGFGIVAIRVALYYVMGGK